MRTFKRSVADQSGSIVEETRRHHYTITPLVWSVKCKGTDIWERWTICYCSRIVAFQKFSWKEATDFTDWRLLDCCQLARCQIARLRLPGLHTLRLPGLLPKIATDWRLVALDDSILQHWYDGIVCEKNKDSQKMMTHTLFIDIFHIFTNQIPT